MDNSYCCVPFCSSTGNNIPRMSFHRFPSKEEKLRRLKWIAALRVGKKVSKRMVVCGKHFQPSDFMPRGPQKVKCRRLKRTAVPSRYLPTSHGVINTDEENDKVRDIKKLKHNEKSPVLQEKRLPLTASKESWNHTSDMHSNESEEIMNTTTSSADLSNTSDATFDADEDPTYESTTVYSESYERHLPTGKTVVSASKSNSKGKIIPDDTFVSDYPSFDPTPDDTEATLRQKLKAVITVNEMLQKKVKMYQGKCKIYEKEVNILKGVIDNLKLINSVAGDN